MALFGEYGKHVKAPKIKFVGVFDFNKIYSTILNRFSEKGYLITERKNVQKGGSTGNENEIEIYGYRNETEYVQFELEVFFHTWDVEDVEAIVDGEKRIMQKGRVIVDFIARVKTDYQGNFESSDRLKGLRKFYDYNLIDDNLFVQYDDKVYYEMYNFHTAIKQALDMHASYSAY